MEAYEDVPCHDMTPDGMATELGIPLLNVERLCPETTPEFARDPQPNLRR